MNTRHNPALTGNAQALRKNMTKEERHLWYDFLKLHPLTFHRQKIVGSYIVDFCCSQVRIIIELDGSQHYDPRGKQADAVRDQYLTEQGYTVLRYSNAEINMRFQSVCEDINKQIAKVTESENLRKSQKPSP